MVARLEGFRAVATERLERLNIGWVDLERGDEDALSAFRRELHTLKGEASITGFAAVAELAHAVENALDSIFRATTIPSPQHGDLILGALDALAELVSGDPDTPSPDDVLAQLGAIAVPATPPAASPGESAMGTTAAAGPSQANTEGPVRTSTSERRTAAGRGSDGAFLRVSAAQVDRLRAIVGDLIVTRSRLDGMATKLRARRLSRQSMPSELAEGDENIATALGDEVLRFSTLVDSLEDVTSAMRMVPVGTLFDRMPRAVRDLSRALGKDIQLRLAGNEARIDRGLLASLEEPLVHLVRNAADHGIETPSERASRGKPTTGTIEISAALVGSRLNLAVRDDGKGIDLDRVREMAIQRGHLPATTQEISVAEAVQILSLSGVSTRDEVSSVSGRGVGLDVVKTSLSSIGGTLSVESSPSGTCFTISSPVSAAISSLVLFEVGASTYALPYSSVEMIAAASDYDVIEGMGEKAIVYRGQTVPLLSLPQLLGEGGLSNSLRQRRVMIVESGGGLVALTGTVEHRRIEAPLKQVGSVLRPDRLISAGFPLEDGSVALVINTAFLAASAGKGDMLFPRVEDSRVSGTVLVADDSPIVRELLAETLRAAGLLVIEAADGQEAWDLLEKHPEVGLLVTDIEMPRRNGLQLIASVRQRGGPHLPAVVVSTRGSEADKVAAVDVGADDYIVKSDFSRDSLLARVRRFLAMGKGDPGKPQRD